MTLSSLKTKFSPSNIKHRFAMKKLIQSARHQQGIFHHPGNKNQNPVIIEYADSMTFYYEQKYIFENHIYHFSTKKKNPIIIDAGGYIGTATLYFKNIYPDAKITIFEPDKKIFPILKKNIEKNNLKDVSLINKGLGKKEGTVNFFHDMTNGSSTKNIDNLSETNQETIDITQLSKYITEPIDMLKMNIEGAEGDVFEEISSKLHLIKEIIFEYHAFENLPQNLGKILTILDKNNFAYAISNIPGAEVPVPFKLETNYKLFNLVYAKNKNL